MLIRLNRLTVGNGFAIERACCLHGSRPAWSAQAHR